MSASHPSDAGERTPTPLPRACTCGHHRNSHQWDGTRGTAGFNACGECDCARYVPDWPLAARSPARDEPEPAAGFRNMLDVIRHHIRVQDVKALGRDADWIDEVLAEHPLADLSDCKSHVDSMCAAPSEGAEGAPPSEDALLLAEIRKHCRVVYYPPEVGMYPLEHAPHARKDMWDAIVYALRGRHLEPPCASAEASSNE